MIAASALYICRNVLGYAFSEDKQVAKYIKEMTPLLCLSILMDNLQSVFSGTILLPYFLPYSITVRFFYVAFRIFITFCKCLVGTLRFLELLSVK